MAAPIPDTVEGLTTTGPMGTSPTITIGSVMTAVALVVGALGQFGIFTPTPEMVDFAEQYGKLAAGVLVGTVTLFQALVTYRSVFSPNSVATRYVKRYVG